MASRKCFGGVFDSPGAMEDGRKKLHVGVVSIFPEMFAPFLRYGVTGRAVGAGYLRVDCWNPRDFTDDPHRRVDDRPYGGGPGMVMAAPPLMGAVRAAKAAMAGRATVIHLSPQGRRLDQAGVRLLAERERLILVCGRYEGVDERFIPLAVDEEWSVGDYVLSGGEPAAMVLMDAVARWLPGVLGHEDSAPQDSFANGLLDCPHYTRPPVVAGLRVPSVLMSGHHGDVANWRRRQALARTRCKRPDLLENVAFDDVEGACPNGMEGLGGLVADAVPREPE